MLKDKRNYCKIYIVRHGQTDWNIQKKTQGHTNTPLNKAGKIQAGELAKNLRGINFDKIFSSDLLRANQTAEIIALEKKIAVEITELLRERRYGHFEGKNAEALKDFDLMRAALSKEERFKFKPYKDVESDEEVVNRMIRFIREISIIYIGKTILFVTHGGIMRAFLNHLGMDLPNGSIGNGAYAEILSDGVDILLKETQGITLDKK